MRKLRIYTSIIFLLSLLISFSSCEDPEIVTGKEIPEGESTIKVEVGFKEFTPALETRTAGDIIDNIENLWVYVYNTDGSLAMAEEIQDFEYHPSQERVSGKQRSSSYTPTGHVSFKLTLKNGRYRIYTVANKYLAPKEYQTEAALHNVNLQWDNNDMSNNGEMFGWFVKGDNTTVRDEGYQAPLVEITGNHTSLHAWLKRAASKITVAYDGSRLADGVTVYLKSVTIKNLPKNCKLGATNTPDALDQLIGDGEKVTYATSEAYNSSHPALLSNEQTKYPRLSAGDPHSSDNANSMFFYENMQGTGPDKRQKDEDGDGIPDEPYGDYDGMPNGTYIEVDAYYVSTNDERPGQGNIKYRFMLGKNIIDDYNAERNHHFKLTLILKKFANDPDWHIEYQEQHLEVNNPKTVNYQGKYFKPQPTDKFLNQGYDFVNENIVTISAYEEDKETGDKQPLEWDIVGYEVDGVPSDKAPDWLKITETETEESLANEYITAWSVITDPVEPKIFTINSKLANATPKGNSTQPCNLADPMDEGYSKSSSSIADAKNTANTYIVDASGWYIIPLVYGNGRKNASNNTSAYTSSAIGTHVLQKFVDHRGLPITSPFIRESTGVAANALSALFIWQDQQNLLTNLTYVPEAYGGMGGLKFQVPTGRQGNSVIAVKDNSGNVMWSWQIWVTRFDFDETLRLTNRQGKDYDVMSMNLGWCSKDDEEIKYYPGRECTITVQAGELVKDIKIVQKSHTAFTNGTTPHYQWGRKDPFVGRTELWNNKLLYDCYDRKEWNGGDPDRFTQDISYDGNGQPIRNPDGSLFFDPQYDGKRIYTLDLKDPSKPKCNIHEWILHPQKWHNPPHISPGEGGRPYKSIDNTYVNLWGGSENDVETFTKTVYDPCPYGYAVGHYNVFSGFTSFGGDSAVPTAFYDVDLSNMPPGTASIYIDGVFEFYTNDEKFQSICFPEPGYRDWDDRAACYHFSSYGFIWSRQIKSPAYSALEPSKAYYLEFTRTNNAWNAGKTGFVGIQSHFYTADGFAIRPCKDLSL